MTWTPRLAALHQQNTNSISRMSPRWHQLQVSHHGSSHGNRVWKGEITWPGWPGVRPELFHKEHCVFSTHKEPGRKTSKNLGRWPPWGQHRALKRALPGIPKRHPCGSNGSHPCSGAKFLGRPSIIDMNTRLPDSGRSCMVLVDCKIAVCQVSFLLVLIFSTHISSRCPSSQSTNGSGAQKGKQVLQQQLLRVRISSWKLIRSRISRQIE